MRIASWNVNLFNTNRRWDKLRLLELEDWDVALLQEVTPETFEVFTDETGFDGVAGLDLVDGEWSRRSHGVVVLVRRPWTISAATVIPVDDEPRIRARAISAVVTDGSTSLSVASMHMRNAAGDGREAKMAHYEAMHDWALRQDGPLVIGIDANSWWDRLESVSEEVLDGVGDWSQEHRFVAPNARHGLRDALVDYLTRVRPDVVERRRALGAIGEDGALQVTYQRSKNGHIRTSRMDRVYVSSHFEVGEVRTLYSDALTVGSDHAMTIVELV